MAITFDASDPVVIPAVTEKKYSKLFPIHIHIEPNDDNTFKMSVILKRYDSVTKTFLDESNPNLAFVRKVADLTAAELGTLIDWLRNKITT
jgi:hypothetical protein